MNNVPYASLTGVMTDDPNERNSIASFRQFFANCGGLHCAEPGHPMVVILGHGNNARGYQLTMGIFSVDQRGAVPGCLCRQQGARSSLTRSRRPP